MTEHGRSGGAASGPLARLACWLALAALSGACLAHARAAEVIPSKPDRYFNDYAGVVSNEAALRFNEQLAHFERETSNQVVVAVFRKMETDSDIADYTQRIAQSWAVGQGDRRNGAVLFVFIEDRKMFIQVGYGLEGALPDVTAFDITERHIKPRFRAQDYEGGLATGIDLILKAIRGEYKGSGHTVDERRTTTFDNSLWIVLLIFGVFLLIHLLTRRRRRGGWTYSDRGGPFIGFPGGGWSSGGGGGWSSGGGGFSGFSGGGGSFGGGGAGADW